MSAAALGGGDGPQRRRGPERPSPSAADPGLRSALHVRSGPAGATAHRPGRDPDRSQKIDATDGLKPWQLIRRAPAPVWLIVALFAVIMAGWSVVAPLYHAADEPNHADAVMRLEEGRGWTSARTAVVQPEGIGAIAASPYGRPLRPLALQQGPVPQNIAVPRHDRPTWADLKALPGTEGKLSQQIPQHPPGYYWYEAAILRVGGAADWRWDIVVSTMRLLSVLLVMWIPLLTWATAWRMTGSRNAGLCAAVFPLAVPELTHVGSTVNNDTLLALAAGAVVLGLACALRGDRSKGTAVWTGVWLTVALWSKAFALFLLPMVFLVYVVPWARDRWAGRQGRRLEWRPTRGEFLLFALALGIPLALGLWFYLFNYAQYGAIAPGPPDFPPGRFLGDRPALFSRYPTELMIQRWWTDLGWFEVRIPWRTVLASTIVSGLLAIYGVVRRRGRRIALTMLMWPTALSYVVVVAGVTSYYLSTHHIRGISGRYLYVGFVGAAALVGIGAASLPRIIARWMPLLMFLAALAMQIETLHQAVNTWWRPAGGTLRQAWSALSAWSTWPVGVLYTGIGLLVVLIVAVAALLLRAGIVSSYADAEDVAATPVRGAAAADPPSVASEPASPPDGPRHARDVLPSEQPPADSSPPAAH